MQLQASILADEAVKPYKGTPWPSSPAGSPTGTTGCRGAAPRTRGEGGVKFLARQQGAKRRQGFARRTISNMLGAVEDSLGFERTQAEVLRVLYGSRNEQIPGGFLPRGANGTIARGFFQLA